TNNTPFSFDKDAFSLSSGTQQLTRANPELTEAPRVISEEVAYLMDSMLRDVVRRGTGTKANVLKRSDLAGKTGTTNGPTDAWFSGYGGGVVTTTWVGFDDNSYLGRREFGGSAALPIWVDFMRDALAGRPEQRMAQPAGIVSVRINPETGERARVDDPDAIFEVFRAENAPRANRSTQQSMPNDSIEYHEEIF
ncbi:MAG TPA: penicillin-binding transpeptidase domain-containing protein, partial [Marinagarivorans sp.]